MLNKLGRNQYIFHATCPETKLIIDMFDNKGTSYFGSKKRERYRLLNRSTSYVSVLSEDIG